MGTVTDSSSAAIHMMVAIAIRGPAASAEMGFAAVTRRWTGAKTATSAAMDGVTRSKNSQDRGDAWKIVGVSRATSKLATRFGASPIGS